MSGVPPAGVASLPLSVELRVDAACRRFEAAWKAGQRPRLEEFNAFAATFSADGKYLAAGTAQTRPSTSNYTLEGHRRNAPIQHSK